MSAGSETQSTTQVALERTQVEVTKSRDELLTKIPPLQFRVF